MSEPVAAGRATRIDIEAELDAVRHGECAACRITGSHDVSPHCAVTPAAKLMSACAQGHLYDGRYFRECPLCSPRPSEVQR